MFQFIAFTHLINFYIIVLIESKQAEEYSSEQEKAPGLVNTGIISVVQIHYTSGFLYT